MIQDPKKVLKELGLTDSEVSVYLGMVSGVTQARNLVKVTQLKRPTVYYALGLLERRGLISKTEHENSKDFRVEALSKLDVLAQEKMREAQRVQQGVKSLLPTLAQSNVPAERKPTVTFFEGKTAVQRAIMEILYCKDRHVDSVVPKENFFWQVGQDFVKQFVTERVSRDVTTRNLWEEPIATSTLKRYYQDGSEVRILPSIMRGRFQSTTFLFDDKVLLVSSLRNSYCVLITSQEYHDTMQAWFEGLWNSSKRHPQ